jgi:hypothetical protein
MKKIAVKLIGLNIAPLLFSVTLLAAGNVIAKASLDVSNMVCNAIKNEKVPSAFLLDEHGVISKGPIDFGRYPYQYSHQDFYTIWTNYKLIVTPARIKIESCPHGCLELKK